MKARLREARLDAGLNASEVARALDISRSSVSAWENHKRKALPSKENLISLANLYRTTVDSLVGQKSGNVVAGSDLSGTVPIITLDHVLLYGDGLETMDLDYIFCPVPHGPRTYAMKVTGRSMISANPLENSYPEGRIIYCDPGKAETARSGQNVIAVLKNGSAVFKQYQNEDGQRWLRPLNSEYSKISEEFTILAVVIGSFQPE